MTPESTGEKKEAKVVPAAQDTEDSRKLVSEATPYPDPKLTDPTQGTDMNKIDVKNSDEYSKMDLIVNDIKQVIRFSVCVEWEGQASSFFLRRRVYVPVLWTFTFSNFKQLKTPYMDFVDDLELIDRDIRLFRENKHKFWMEKMQKDNGRMYVNTQLKGKTAAFEADSVNPVKYDPMNTQPHRGMERNLLLVPSKTGTQIRILTSFGLGR